MEQKIKINKLLVALKTKSKFRAKQKLGEPEYNICVKLGMERMKFECLEILEKKIKAAYPYKDGKQTPYRKHPVFTAQHATATCCRHCLKVWHFMPMGIPLTNVQLEYLSNVIIKFLESEMQDIQENNRFHKPK